MNDPGERPLFTVLLPVHRPPALLPFAIESVLAQEERRFELFVVCDGTPPETVEVAESYAARDPRVRVFSFPKGERHGELHRHAALEEARGELVAHLGDDDLWFPAYLAELARLLADVDFGNLLQAEAEPGGGVLVRAGDLADPRTRARMLEEPWNFFGPTFAGYRLQTYRELPVGWSPAPPDLATDLFMWRKLLRQPGVRCGTRFAVEGIKLAAVARAGVSLAERADEARAMVEAVATPAGRREVRARGMASLHAELRAEVDGMLTSRSWTVTRPLRAVTDWGRAQRARRH